MICGNSRTVLVRILGLQLRCVSNTTRNVGNSTANEHATGRCRTKLESKFRKNLRTPLKKWIKSKFFGSDDVKGSKTAVIMIISGFRAFVWSNLSPKERASLRDLVGVERKILNVAWRNIACLLDSPSFVYGLLVGGFACLCIRSNDRLLWVANVRIPYEKGIFWLADRLLTSWRHSSLEFILANLLYYRTDCFQGYVNFEVNYFVIFCFYFATSHSCSLCLITEVKWP